MDPFYCLVRIILNKQLSLYCFNYNFSVNIDQKILKISYPLCFTAKSSKNILKLFSLHPCYNLISTNHAFYLAIELYKAELCLVLHQSYTQD